VFANLVRELAQGCGSSAWVYAVVAEHGWMFSLFPKEGQDEIWSGNPNARGCAAVEPSGKAEKVEGGYRLPGQWRFVSGSDHAHWVFLTVPADEGEDFIVVRQLLVRRAELEALDDWHVMGLIGTGSRTLVADNIFVPDRRAITQEEMMLGTAPGTRVHPDYPLIRTPRRYLTAFSLSPVLIGLANRALALVMEGTRKRMAAGALPPDLDALQLRIAETAADLDAANTLLDAHLTEAMARVAAGAAISERDIARSRMAGAYIGRLAQAATARLCMASGSGWIFNSNPLQEVFRDVTAGATHRAMNVEMLGKNYVRALGVDAPR
jgi:alkylation response protein AidB-like acyl-CoA dehydrogenase